MSDDTNGPDGSGPSLPASLLPYEAWLEEAQRDVMLKALEHVGEHGLPGEHHFYMTFLTNAPGVQIPARLKERYPEEMTIVLQHQFQNLTVDRQARFFSVGLSFGGIPGTLHIPFGAITAFADPHIHLVLHFNPARDEPEPPAGTETEAAGQTEDHDRPAEILRLHNATTPHSPSRDTGEGTTERAPAGESEADRTDHERKEGAEVVSLAAFRKKPSGESDRSPDGNDH